MKIIPASSSEPLLQEEATPKPAMEVVSPSVTPPRPEVTVTQEKMAALQENISLATQEMKNQWLGELQALQDKFDQVRARLTDQLLQNTRQVAKLSNEIAAMRDVIADFKLPKPSEPTPPPQDGPAKFQPIEKGVADEPAPPKTEVVLPHPLHEAMNQTKVILEPTERKIAFIAKLWDYLNQVAFEIPLHKTNRSN